MRAPTHCRFLSRRAIPRITALALGLSSVACSDTGPESPIIQAFIEAVSGGTTNGTPRPGIPPRSGGGGSIIGEFLNRARPGAKSQFVVRSSAPIGRIVIAVENTLNYYEIIPPSPFLDVGGGASPTQATSTAAPRAAEVVLSLQFAAAPPMPVFNLRIAAASTADGPLGEYTSVPVDLSNESDPAIGLTPATLSFTAVQRGAAPPASNVAIDNSGTGRLDRLSIGTIAFTPAGTAWLNVALQGQTAPTSATLTVTTTNLAPGTYTASVPVQSPAARETPRNITVTYVVTADPQIGLTPATLSFTAVQRGALPPASNVAIGNSGTGTLDRLSIGTIAFTPAGSAWLSVALQGQTAPTSATLTVTTTTLAPGTYTASVPVQSPAAREPRNINVTYVVTADPQIGMTPATLSFTAAQGGALPGASKVAIDNSGTGTLDRLSIGTIAFTPAASAWLSVALQGQTAPTSATVTVTTTNLAPGTYSASVPVQSPAARVTAVNFTVTYVVTPPPPPSIVLSSDSIEFRAVVRGVNPQPQAVNVTNGGGGTLSGLSLGTITFTPTTNSPWLTAAIGGTTAPTSVQLQVSVFNLIRGTYIATVPVRTSTPNVPQKLLRVRFVVDNP